MCIFSGITSSHKLHLNIFSLSDGKGALVELTKSLCQSVLAGHMKATDINQDIIDKKLQAEIDIPDPELALYCGDVCSTYGFLPWQIRVTEFL
jgi:dehydrodolichyl diphosphate syntase complex subunit NUS1